MHALDSNDEMITGINVVPLVDIILVVLIIFLVTATFVVRPAIDVELPRADTGDRKERNQFSVLLARDGALAIADQGVPEAGLPQALRERVGRYRDDLIAAAAADGRQLTANVAEARTRDELTMIVQADTAVPHGRVIWVIDEARKAGIQRYAFNVDPAVATVGVAR